MPDTTAPWVPDEFDVEAHATELKAAADAIVPLQHPCPDWCTDTHTDDARWTAVDRADNGLQQLTRFHHSAAVAIEHPRPDEGVTPDAIRVEIQQMEHTDTAGNVTRHRPAVVISYADGIDLAPAVARQVAAEMVAAAARIEAMA